MKWRSLFFLFTCLLMQKLVSGDGEPFTYRRTPTGYDLTCSGGKWESENLNNTLPLEYKDENSKEYVCRPEKGDPIQLLVQFRTCENCIDLDITALSFVIVGNLLATVLIAWAVYSITGQPKGRNFSGNKASDKVNLISNGERDTYQQLTPGQNSEYSGLVGVRKK
ncbi:T-cell surface glycoprotein CD3 delta chain [Pangasianodon hypophthalmus]|uniref:T-cell surface glycoprotein CD3 delta chain n=1 Tax=Pangasianodon hypophthalmus TaxID=310915 RepID=UPI0023078885|nr:T-cell surface glycoprotein CD3 delta chain [Pangasianodon hypophthalmus]XP_026799121.3 T-cell surface glycoprotein CD3 delta chain [Pangasianodon hypophthalmus]